MDTLSYKTISVNKATASQEWVVVDAEGQVLGRLASKVAKILRGKNKATFTPHAECGDYVIVINAEKVVLTGNKMSDKVYIRHSGYPGGQREQTASDILTKYPERLVEKYKNSSCQISKRILQSKSNNYAHYPQAGQQPGNIYA